MSKGKLSVGDDTGSGEPNTGPEGPYITDRRDDQREAGERRETRTPPEPPRRRPGRAKDD